MYEAGTDAWSEVEQQFNLNALKCANKHSFLVSAPTRQTARETHPGSPEEYYCKSLGNYVPRSSKIYIYEIKSRFASHVALAMKCLCIVPSCFSHQITNDDEIVEFFSSDLEYISATNAELHHWWVLQGVKQLPDTSKSALKHAILCYFEIIWNMILTITRERQNMPE